MHPPQSDRAAEAGFASLIEAARRDDFDSDAIAHLARALADSGEQMSWAPEVHTADVASTGGPGSLSTLIGPLVLSAQGWSVVKLGVPGRPAGAIDSLGTLRGYRVNLGPDEVRGAVSACGFAHFLADGRFAPMDAAFFRYRQSVDAVAIPGLAAASILSKKLAVGVRSVALDVRIGSHGNFGPTWEAARLNASRFCGAAKILGIRSTATLTASADALQPFIGRGEALVALASAVGLSDSIESPWLENHVLHCHSMADSLRGNRGKQTIGSDIPQRTPTRRALLDALSAHLDAQGSSLAILSARVAEVTNSPHRVIHSPSTGVLGIDLGLIRRALVHEQRQVAAEAFSDPAGVELLVRPGSIVRSSDALARIRSEEPARLLDLEAELRSAFSVLDEESHVAEGQSPETEMIRG